MPANKEAILRYKLIDKILRNKYRPFPSMTNIIDFLEEKLGKEFSDSTIQKDIKSMKEDELLGYKAPIKYSVKERGYYYTDPNYTMAEVPLGDEDIAAIEFAATTLQQYQEVGLFKEFGSAVDKIFNAINISSVLDEDEIENIIQFEQVPYFKGREYISELLKHIKEREVVSIDYHRFDLETKKTHVLHPYILKEYRHRWYLIGMLEKNGHIITLGLDRINAIRQKEDIAFRWHNTFSSKSYFQGAFGITTFDGKPEKVELSFTPTQGAYIKTQPLHHSQKIVKETKDGVVISLEIGVTIEFIMAIMSYGANVKVLSPESLQNRIKETIEMSLAQYD
ncbi:MAG: helix-turn-helix transcriptional regulator [Chitinophagales bacterium]